MHLSQVTSYINYWLHCVDEYSIHSPFFFAFYQGVIKVSKEPYIPAEEIRHALLQNNTVIYVDDWGAGSILRSEKRRIKDIARVSISRSKFSQLYAHAIKYFGCKTIVELGASLGVNTLYLSQYPGTHVTTFEGSPLVAEIANKHFKETSSHNIELIEGNIDSTLVEYVSRTKMIDFAFIDANHRYDAVLSYFDKLLSVSHPHTLFVFDDIYLNTEMTKAWRTIQKHPAVFATADLYRCGFVFLDPSLGGQDWVLQY